MSSSITIDSVNIRTYRSMLLALRDKRPALIKEIERGPLIADIAGNTYILIDTSDIDRLDRDISEALETWRKSRWNHSLPSPPSIP